MQPCLRAWCLTSVWVGRMPCRLEARLQGLEQKLAMLEEGSLVLLVQSAAGWLGELQGGRGREAPARAAPAGQQARDAAQLSTAAAPSCPLSNYPSFHNCGTLATMC